MSYPIYAFTLEEFERQKNLIDYAGDSSAWANFARRKGSKDKKKRKSRVGTALKIGGAVAGLAGLGLAGKRYIGAGIKKASSTAPLTGDTKKQFARRLMGGAKERLEGDVAATGKRLRRWKGRAQNLAENTGVGAQKAKKEAGAAWRRFGETRKAKKSMRKSRRTRKSREQAGKAQFKPMRMGKKPMGMGGMGMMQKKSMMMGKKPMSMGMKY